MMIQHGMRWARVVLLSALAVITLLAAGPVCAVDLNTSGDTKSDIEEMLKACRVPDGMKLELWAAEPHLAHPVAFCMDEKGRIFVAELHRMADAADPKRRDTGVLDLRKYWDMLDDDLSARTVAERAAMLKKHVPDKLADFQSVSDILRLVEDRDGDGKADHATIFADDFKGLVDGPAAGVLARKGDVYFTCIPDVWLLKDTKNTGVADVKKSLHTGYGVRIAFLGHDLHGLLIGPDGRLYFSIGDRGYHVESEGKTFANNANGAVFRCELDGSGLEVVATGMRNPQELGLRQLRKSLRRRQQLRPGRPLPHGLGAGRRRQRLAHRLSACLRTEHHRPLARRETLVHAL